MGLYQYKTDRRLVCVGSRAEDVLRDLRRGGPLPSSHVATMFDIISTDASNLLKTMRRRGLVVNIEHRGTGHPALYQITMTGEQCLRDLDMREHTRRDRRRERSMRA